MHIWKDHVFTSGAIQNSCVGIAVRLVIMRLDTNIIMMMLKMHF